MPYDLTIAERCRDYGLRVVEYAGWQTRGSSEFNPRGSVNHHTAGSPSGAAPSLRGVVFGFDGSAPGPLAHAHQSRDPNGNDIITVVAAGRANHAGLGGWRGLTGNSSVIGLEIEHTGVVPLPEHRQEIAARFHAAMADGRWPVTMVCQHREWAPSRKIDAATQVDPVRFRAMVQHALTPAPKPPPPLPRKEVHDMFYIQSTDGKYHLFGSGERQVGFCKQITRQTAVELREMGYPFQEKWHPLQVIALMKDFGVWTL